VATNALPEQVQQVFAKAVPTGIRHGTVTVIEQDHPVEVTTYRADGPYTDGRHPDWVRFGVNLDDDLARRDLTVNALAFDPETRALHDPQGGVADLGRRVLRTVGDPDRRFAEDGLRPLRAVRLAAVLEFTVEPATLAAIGRARDRVVGVARERIRDELIKLLASPRPSIGIELMRETGLLTVLIPELTEGVGMTQNRHHAYDVYEHTLRTVDAAPLSEPQVRLAALLHDVGKPRTRAVVDGEGTFYRHEQVGEGLAREILERYRFPRRDIDTVSHLVGQHMFHYTPDWTDGTVRRFIRRVGREHLEALFTLRRADNVGNGTKAAEPEDFVSLRERVRDVLAREPVLDVGALAVDGADLMRACAIPEGPEVGRVLRELLTRVIDDPELNRRDILLDMARKLTFEAGSS